MRFSTKIFCAIFLTAMLVCVSTSVIIYSVFKRNIEDEYFARYKSLGKIMSNTFSQMEGSANLINENAVRVLFEIEKNNGLPGDKKLDLLAKKIGNQSILCD